MTPGLRTEPISEILRDLSGEPVPPPVRNLRRLHQSSRFAVTVIDSEILDIVVQALFTSTSSWVRNSFMKTYITTGFLTDVPVAAQPANSNLQCPLEIFNTGNTDINLKY